MSITITDEVNATIEVDGQASAQLLWGVIDYALNNITTLSPEDRAEIENLRTVLATLY